MPADMVYVLVWADPHYPDRPYVYADREDALADERIRITEWRKEYASHAGLWMYVAADPTGYTTREVAPGPETGARWSRRAMAAREL